MYIYVIAEQGASLVKIGRATRVASRLAQLRTASPVDLMLRAHWTGTEADESMLHSLFSGKRVRGEWFEFGGTDPVSAITKALGRDALPPLKVRSRGAAGRGKRDVDSLPDGPRPGRRALQAYRSPTGGVIVQRECMSTCYGDMLIWEPGQHTHTTSMSAQQYEEFGPDGPPLEKAAPDGR